MKKLSKNELLTTVRTELNGEIAWLNHHIGWLKDELKKEHSYYYEGLLNAYIEIKADLTRISNLL